MAGSNRVRNMANRVKAIIRDILPRAAQVPVKYWTGRVRGFHEPEMALLPYLASPGHRVIDVGANRGTYSYKLWKLGALVEMFEPNPMCSRVLAAWSEGRSGVVLHPYGLSDHAGNAELHIPVDSEGVEHDASASIEDHSFKRMRDQIIELHTVDDFKFYDVAFIKIDVEGHEFSVIMGAEKTLARERPALLVEIEQRHCSRQIEDVFAMVLAHGYRGFYMSAGALLPLAEFNAARDQASQNFGRASGRYINNFLFLHETRCASNEYELLFRKFGAR